VAIFLILFFEPSCLCGYIFYLHASSLGVFVAIFFIFTLRAFALSWLSFFSYASNHFGLVRTKPLPLHSLARVNLHNIVLNDDAVVVECPRRWFADDIPGQVEGGGMAGALEAVHFFIPDNGTPQVRAFARQCHESPALQPRQIEVPPLKGSYGIHRKVRYRAACN